MRRLLLSLAAALLLAGCVRRLPDTGPLRPGEHLFHLHDGEGNRRVRLHVPPSADGTSPLPLVVALHGAYLDSDRMRDMTGWSALADREGFAVLYPEGRRAPYSLFVRSWNAGDCCLAAMHRGNDDVAFVLKAIDHVAERVPIERHRLYVTGFSNGGMLAHRLAMEHPERVSAIGTVAGSFGVAPPLLEGTSLRVMMIAMRDDYRVPYEGLTRPLRGFRASLPMQVLAEAWASSLNVPKTRTTMPAAGITVTDYRDRVRFVVLDQGDHSWPGGRRAWTFGIRPSRDYDATSELWRFFTSAQRRPPVGAAR